MHYRTQIRSAVKQILEGLPPFTGRCHINRGRPFAQADLPAVCIYTRRSGAERHIDQWRDKKTTTLEIELHATGKDEAVLAADMDALCLLIESELFKDQTLGGVCEDIEHKGDEIETDAENAMVTVHCRMSFEVTVIFENTDTSTVDSFYLVGAEWDVVPKDGEIAARDEIPLDGSGFVYDGETALDGVHLFSGLP